MPRMEAVTAIAGATLVLAGSALISWHLALVAAGVLLIVSTVVEGSS